MWRLSASASASASAGVRERLVGAEQEPFPWLGWSGLGGAQLQLRPQSQMQSEASERVCAGESGADADRQTGGRAAAGVKAGHALTDCDCD